MDYKKYQTLARRTESFIGDIDYRLDHACKGLVTESIELFAADDDANEVEELGDILWYLDLGCAALGINLSDLNFDRIPTDRKDIDYILIAVGDFTDILKREKFYRASQNADGVKECFSRILAHIISICTEKGYELVDVMEKNIEKLAKRYPDKYSDELATNRDLEKERAVFE